IHTIPEELFSNCLRHLLDPLIAKYAEKKTFNKVIIYAACTNKCHWQIIHCNFSKPPLTRNVFITCLRMEQKAHSLQEEVVQESTGWYLETYSRLYLHQRNQKISLCSSFLSIIDRIHSASTIFDQCVSMDDRTRAEEYLFFTSVKVDRLTKGLLVTLYQSSLREAKRHFPKLVFLNPRKWHRKDTVCADQILKVLVGLPYLALVKKFWKQCKSDAPKVRFETHAEEAKLGEHFELDIKSA
ncbi:MAG: hypothetical protein AAGI90_07125, partial [Chlamydiota bacterium]